MKNRITQTTRLLVTLLFAWPALTLAAIPNGVMLFEFTESNIYDLSHFNDCETDSELGLTLTLCLDVEMVPDGRGKHTGIATMDFSGDISGTLTGPASGSVRGTAGSDGKARLKFAATGDLTGLGLTLSTELKARCNGVISPSGFLSSLCTIRVRVEGAGSESVKGMFDYQLNGGPWSFTMDVTPVDARKFTGTGTDSLGYTYTVSGRYSDRSDTSRVRATGLRDTTSNGAKIQLKELTAGGAAEAKFKVQGFRGAEYVQAAP
jgi:hypothetical protein